MATKNVLQYVQACLSTMDSDNVDSITDTSESMQVAELLQDLYFELLNRQEWSFLHGPQTLTSSADPAFPTSFAIPSGLRHLRNVWYNVHESGGVARRELKYFEPTDFLTRFGSGGPQANKQLVTLPGQIQFYVRNDMMPHYYTSFDGVSLVCDSFDSAVESTLQAVKISAYGVGTPAFTVQDDFVPKLPEHMVPLLQHTLNAASHLYFKQQASSVDEIRVRRQLAQARSRESKLTREHYYANAFGRR